MIKNQERSSLPSFPAAAAMNKHNGINRLWSLRLQVITALPPPQRKGTISTPLEILLLPGLGLSLHKGQALTHCS